jgi:hypothetical protein
MLREGFMCRRERLDTPAALVAAARHIDRLDVKRFASALDSPAVKEAFADDLALAREAAGRAGEKTSGDRPELPSLEFHGDDGRVRGVYGYADHEDLQAVALAAGAQRSDDELPSIEDALRRYGTLASVEVAAVCQLPGPRAQAELWRLALDERVSVEGVLGGELWCLAAG